MKVLFCASYPDQPIGYSRIANILSNFLADQNIDVYYFGFSNYKHLKVNRYINPKIHFIDVLQKESIDVTGTGETRNQRFRRDWKSLELSGTGDQLSGKENFGTTIICDVVEEIKPDMIFIYNDIIVTCRLFNSLQDYKKKFGKTYKMIVYIDLVYKFEKPLYIEYLKNEADFIFVFSDVWKSHLVDDFKFDQKKIEVLYHGFNQSIFFKVDKHEARKKLGIKLEDFIVLNTNRNTYRKGWDISISSFLQFYLLTKCDARVKLLINCRIDSTSGFNIIELVKISCIKLGLDYNHIINNQIIQLPNASELSDSVLNLVYNAVDVGLNTCIGEGFGLCNLEGACLDVPQVVSYVGGLIDMFSSSVESMTVKPTAVIQCSNLQDDHIGDLEICDSKVFAKKIYDYYLDEKKREEDGMRIGETLRNKYDWDKILDEFKNNLHF
jgi:glycosyltransferase involved in cell wall biosynthesis